MRAERRSIAGIVARALGVLVAAGFVALLVYGVLAQSPDTTIDDGLADGRSTSAPGFELDVLEPGSVPDALRPVVDRAAADGRIALRELRGTPVVLNFWASWCDPCRSEAPVLERGWRAAGRDRVLFLGLDMQDVSDDARDFLRELRVTYPNVREGGKEVARRYGATGLPETYFISARGEVVGHVIGAIEDSQLRDGVRAARAGRPRPLGRGGETRPTR
jgi:cytochrome c biogenesis protein CcmG, thiol:disulfide interchange protein DsbE